MGYHGAMDYSITTASDSFTPGIIDADPDIRVASTLQTTFRTSEPIEPFNVSYQLAQAPSHWEPRSILQYVTTEEKTAPNPGGGGTDHRCIIVWRVTE